MKKLLILLLLIYSGINVYAQNYNLPPEQLENNLIVATYNIQWLGSKKHDFEKLANVISKFDVCGIQEVKNERSLPDLIKKLEELTKEDWGYVFGFRTFRPHGTYHESFAVVWRKDKVELGDGLISNIWDKEESYRNDPFMCSFKSGNFDFTLFLIHTRWSNDDDGNRENEINAITEHLNFFKQNQDERDIILMGDFNYSGADLRMKNMAEDNDFQQLDYDPKTTFKKNYSDYSSSYDHIYINPYYTKEFIGNSCFAFDVTKFVYGEKTIENMKLSKSELSDHLPVFAVFKTDMEDDD